MNSIFDYARNKIRKKYQNNNRYVTENGETLESIFLSDIDFYEKKSKKGFTNAISCRYEVFKMSLTDNEVGFLWIALIAFSFVFYVFIQGAGEYPMNILILDCSRCFFFYTAVMAIYFIYRFIKSKIIKNPLYYIVWALFFALSIPHIPVLLGYQTTQIGNFYESQEYKAKYYVIMSRKPESVKNRKQYTLPAEIERRKDYLYTTEATEDYYQQPHGGNEVSALNYHINRLYFPNGGYLVFDHDEAYDNPENTDIELNKETRVTDYHGNNYYIMLTDRKVSE